MRFVYSDIGIDISVPEDKILVITLERPDVFSKVLNDMWQQTKGLEGAVAIVEGEEVIKLSKTAHMIFNPFDIDCNDRKVLNAIYSEIKEISSEQHLDIIAEANQKNIELIDVIADKLDYSITYDLDVDIIDIFKMYGVKLLTDDECLTSRIIDYIKLLHRILKTNFFILVNFKQFLNIDDIKNIYEAAIYEKVNLVVIQTNYKDKIVNEYNVIVDADLCMIEP